ncbi:uncharacterized protein BJX67DRAFT_156145 [Aspergillus lucknowensis]|uniref:Uncharacterized protein n=1 Tax=Aspergillus lucknowensis TaxID=176173 RepID=A0ABR4LMR1_9EURO
MAEQTVFCDILNFTPETNNTSRSSSSPPPAHLLSRFLSFSPLPLLFLFLFPFLNLRLLALLLRLPALPTYHGLAVAPLVPRLAARWTCCAAGDPEAQPDGLCFFPFVFPSFISLDSFLPTPIKLNCLNLRDLFLSFVLLYRSICVESLRYSGPLPANTSRPITTEWPARSSRASVFGPKNK